MPSNHSENHPVRAIHSYVSTATVIYKVLALPKLEHVNTVWDPHKAEDKCALDNIQRGAACFVTVRYRNRSSVSDMLDQLTRSSAGPKARATMAYRIRHHLVSIPADPFLECPATRSDGMKTKTYSHAVPVPLPGRITLKHSFFHRTPVILNSLAPEDAAAKNLFKPRVAEVMLLLWQF